MKLSKFDLSKQVGSKSLPMALKNPVTGEDFIDEASGEPITIDLVSIDSDEHQKARHRMANARIRKATTSGRATVKSEEMERDAIELLVACTKGWHHIQDDDESELPFTTDNARKIYGNPGFRWLTDQVSAFINERAAFLGN